MLPCTDMIIMRVQQWGCAVKLKIQSPSVFCVMDMNGLPLLWTVARITRFDIVSNTSCSGAFIWRKKCTSWKPVKVFMRPVLRWRATAKGRFSTVPLRTPHRHEDDKIRRRHFTIVILIDTPHSMRFATVLDRVGFDQAEQQTVRKASKLANYTSALWPYAVKNDG